MRKLLRVNPDFFDEKKLMIGRSGKDMVWKEFVWGEKNDLMYEYCPLNENTEVFLGTRMSIPNNQEWFVPDELKIDKFNI